MVITGSKIDCLGSGRKENVEQSWRDLEIGTLRPEMGKIIGKIGNFMYDSGDITMILYSD